MRDRSPLPSPVSTRWPVSEGRIVFEIFFSGGWGGFLFGEGSTNRRKVDLYLLLLFL